MVAFLQPRQWPPHILLEPRQLNCGSDPEDLRTLDGKSNLIIVPL